MGRDPMTSMLNEWNQVHHCKNVFVTDGSCMTSTGTQNPALTFMALTARVERTTDRALPDAFSTRVHLKKNFRTADNF